MTALEEEGPRGTSRASKTKESEREEQKEGLRRGGLSADLGGGPSGKRKSRWLAVGWIHTGKSSCRCLSAFSQSRGGENLEWKMM